MLALFKERPPLYHPRGKEPVVSSDPKTHTELSNAGFREYAVPRRFNSAVDEGKTSPAVSALHLKSSGLNNVPCVLIRIK